MNSSLFLFLEVEIWNYICWFALFVLGLICGGQSRGQTVVRTWAQRRSERGCLVARGRRSLF